MTNQYGRWVPDPLSASGFRWQRHDEQPATQMLPVIQPPPLVTIDPDEMPPEDEHAHGGDE